MSVIAPVVRPWNPNTTNDEIVAAIRHEASSEYQRRIPDAIKADAAKTLAELNNYQPLWNEFVDAIINKIGLTIARNESWSNPFARYKKGIVSNGSVVEELQIGLIKGYKFDPRREYGEKANFGKHLPEVASSYHTINREFQYVVTVQRPTLQRAFTSDTGLSDFIMQLMAAATTSDNLDEYLQTVALFAKYEEYGGFFKTHVDDIADYNSTPDQARRALRTMREFGETLPFISRNYNAAGMEVHADPEKLILITTPQFKSGLDVNALAELFNVPYAEVPYRTHVIPREDMNLQGGMGILTTEDFFQIYDTYFNTDSMPNPAGRSQNYFLNHDQIISASRFVPAVLFTTGEGDSITISDRPITGVDDIVITNAQGSAATNVERGGNYIVTAPATTDGDATATILTLKGSESVRTYLVNSGPFHVALDEEATSLTIEAVSEKDSSKKKTRTVAVVGERVDFWPNPEVNSDDDNDGLLEVTPKAPTFTNNVIKVPNSDKVEYRDGSTPVNGQEITVTTGTKTITTVAKTGYEVKPGAPASWPFAFVAP